MRRRGGSGEAENPFWITYSDLLSSMVLLLLVLLVIFIQISQEQQRELEKKNKANQELIDAAGSQAMKEFIELKNILEPLEEELRKLAPQLNKISNGQVQYDAAKLEFSVGNQLLFDTGKADMKDAGKKVLSKIVPPIAEVITKDKYEKVIAGIIFEGRADFQGSPDWNENYAENLQLTQERSASVINYVFDSRFTETLKSTDQKQWPELREKLRRKVFGSGRSNMEAVLQFEAEKKDWKAMLKKSTDELAAHRRVVIRLQLFNILRARK